MATNGGELELMHCRCISDRHRKHQVETLTNYVHALIIGVDTLLTDVDTLTTNVDTLTNDVNALTNDVNTLSDHVDTLTNDVHALSDHVDALTNDVDPLTNDVWNVYRQLRGSSLLFLDTADVKEFTQHLPLGIFHGVTTNPLILERCGVECTVESMEALSASAFEVRPVALPFVANRQVDINVGSSALSKVWRPPAHRHCGLELPSCTWQLVRSMSLWDYSSSRWNTS